MMDIALLLEEDPSGQTCWATWTGAGEPLQLLLRYCPASEWDALIRQHTVRAGGQSRLALPEDVDKTFWLDHVVDWRGVVDRQHEPVAFDRDLLAKLWDRLPMAFREWLRTTCQSLDTFRAAD